MLNDRTSLAVREYFTTHAVIGRYLDRVCVCLTGSYALGLGGRGADIDLKVLAPQVDFEEIRSELVTTGRAESIDEPGEELTSIVGDYTLESLEDVRKKTLDYTDLAQVFVYGHLVYLLGKSSLVEDLVAHCRNIPHHLLQEELQREEAILSKAQYAFLRSFQNGDPVGRLLSRSTMLRSAMRIVFLTEKQAPPHDKHLFRLLAGTERGARVAEAILEFLQASQEDVEEERYKGVAASNDWHEMYECAEGTPAITFGNQVLAILHLP